MALPARLPLNINHAGQKWNADGADKGRMNADFFRLLRKISDQ
jgi:hypothetical protein